MSGVVRAHKIGTTRATGASTPDHVIDLVAAGH